MTTTKLLKVLIAQAALNGFSLEKWFLGWLGIAWQSEDHALAYLETSRNYFVLLFSHEFAQAFWRTGSRITFVVPTATYSYRDKKGEMKQVQRKPYTRRRLKADAWKWHLRAMACADDPLAYIRRFILVGVEVSEAPAPFRKLPRKSAGSHSQK